MRGALIYKVDGGPLAFVTAIGSTRPVPTSQATAAAPTSQRLHRLQAVTSVVEARLCRWSELIDANKRPITHTLTLTSAPDGLGVTQRKAPVGRDASGRQVDAFPPPRLYTQTTQP